MTSCRTLAAMLGSSRRSFLVGATALVIGACASGDADAPGDPAASGDDHHISPGEAADPADLGASAAGYPPATFDELDAIFDPIYRPMGLTLTRAALIDRSDGGYVMSPAGRHLALYVEPIDDAGYDVNDYVEAIVPVTVASAPLVFDRWPEVDSYDICQEPAEADDPRTEPFPVTQLELSRADYDSIDVGALTLAGLIEVTLRRPETSRLAVSRPIREHPTYVAALIEAQEAIA